MQTSLDISTARALRFAVPGHPRAQGSKSARIVGKRVVLVELADMAKKTRPGGGLKRWRKRVAARALVEMHADGLELFDGPVELTVEFVLPRPAGHYTKAGGRLKKSAPAFPALPDLSKLVRAIEDAMSGVVYNDDRQIVRTVSSKRYAARGGIGGALVGVREIEP